jgi:hypothetical protein
LKPDRKLQSTIAREKKSSVDRVVSQPSHRAVSFTAKNLCEYAQTGYRERNEAVFEFLIETRLI